jgi:hypothetical protein
MFDKFEFSDAKQVRKTLLITSFAGICFKSLVRHSTGNIEFLGFKIPVEDASVIPSLFGYLIIYFLATLLIRYSDEKFKEQYNRYSEHIKRRAENIEKGGGYSTSRELLERELGKELHELHRKLQITKFGVLFVDILFPIIFGLFALFVIFFR